MSKYFKYINTLFVVTPMTFFMALIAMVTNSEQLSADSMLIFFKSWLAMLPIAYALAFVILPLARKASEKLLHKKIDY